MRRRDDQEFADFAVAARPRLRRTAYLLSGDWELAADLAQEALVRVYVAWPRLHRAGEGVHAYARRCAVSAWIDWTRKRSNRELPTSAEVLDRGQVEGPAEPLAVRDELMGALRELGPRQRACVVLRYYDDLGVADTARVLGCTEGTVKSQTAKALASLRRHLELRDLVAAAEGGL
ncbi:SigE family RNA polymerase sigma factor [Nocardioides guangzhouensis]|uniref:SigE family RNA polymerase sigma factor n=1 Tax=Nocardioides guangzhouensis TaxID=2497878 RepID=A0A4Q4ZB85_9ACTN|nr:SigE family RNA polymerase sigma factor [Nocardioides guangzhouensis]RYP85217.1 SigE family RNA polymerase sigma factor [Nocardioides guangzhouensis]